MKLQKIILCIAIASAAFGASLGLLDIGCYLKTAFARKWQNAETIQPVAEKNISHQATPSPFSYPKFEPDPDKNSEETKLDFIPVGHYFIVGKLPREFNEVTDLRIEVVDHSRDSKTDDTDELNFLPGGG